MTLTPATPESIAFGGFRLLPHRRKLLAGDEAIKLGGRAFDLLLALIETPGAIVSKDDLAARVWPGRVVSENNLQAQILALRKAFGAERDLIRTVAGRGYQFTGAIDDGSAGADKRVAAALPVAARGAVVVPTNLPQPVSELIGREAEVEEVSNRVRADRLVTLAGAGGIGKTRLALAAARRLLPLFPDGVWLVELSPLSDSSLVPATVAAAAGLELGGGELSARRVALALATRRLLLVLDTCEHVIDAAATMAEAVLRAGSAAHIIATSREPLRAEGEQVFPVPPLAVPAEDAGDLLGYGAVRLFVERAQAVETDVAPDRRWALTIAGICRHLDGIPLAIEFAAARATTLGAPQVAKGLEDRFALLTGGRRTALPRHQTLRATLDWSYDLLPEAERHMLRHLAIFAGGFTLEGAAAVTSGNGGTVDTIANLVAKSLIIFEGSGSLSRYRMLETTRAYAMEKLKTNNEFAAASRRHAKYHSDLFGQAREDWERQPTAAWLAEYGNRLDDLRATLDWAFSSGGDATLGMALTVDAVPLWMQRSLMGECRRRVEQALSYIEAETSENARLRMRLWTALSLSRMYAGNSLAEIDAAWSATLDLAEQVGDPDYQLRAVWGLFAGSFNRGNFRAALQFAEQFCRVATDAAGRLIGERLVGTALHILGDQQNARRHIEHMLAGYSAPVTSSHIIRFQNDQVIAARRVLAPILWLQGYPDQAMRMVQDAVTDALSLDHTLTLCNLLAQAACPLAFLAGDLSAAKQFTALLVEQATRHSLDVWNTYGRCFTGLLLTKESNFEPGLSRMRDAGNDMRQAGFLQYYTPYLGLLAEALAAAGQIAPGLAAIDEAIERAGSTEERWGIAELLRVKGGLLLLQGGPGARAAAEDHFRQALDWARRQGALSWELRAAMSMARLLYRSGPVH